MAKHKQFNGVYYYRLPEYTVWASMKDRCSNPKSNNYHNYGGIGIRVCERWSKFDNFFDDMGPRPSKSHTLDRINNGGNYEPSNCRWATIKEQANNKRTSRFIEINGEVKTMAQWIELSGVKGSTVSMRLQRGWKPEKALNITSLL